jgi:hypothetical protein
LKGFVYVEPEGFEADRQLEWWVGLGVSAARAAATAVVRKPKRPNREKKR